MKKFLKIIGIIIGVILLLIIILPFAFKGKIEQAIKKEINKNIKAQVDWKGYGLSLFRTFPDFTVRLDDLTIVGIENFEKDTLANIPELFVAIDLMTVFRGDYEINTIHVDDAKLLFKVLPDGMANWDIVVETPGETDTVSTEPSAFKVGLKKFELNNAFMVYDDKSINTFVKLEGYDLQLKGDFTADLTQLSTRSEVAKVTVDYEGIRYLNKADADLVADIDADLVNYKFTFAESDLRVNQLFLGFKGFFTMPDEGYDMDITFDAKKTDFKNLLSLVPAIYSKDFEKVQTSGNIVLNGFVKGHYGDNAMPAFGITLKVDNAMFKYPDLPKSVDNIAINASVNSPSSNMDDMVVDVPLFHAEMAGNPVDAKLMVKKVASDPALDAAVKGTLDLGKVKEFYPLEEGDELNGIFTANLEMSGKSSDLEKGNYEDFNALGSLQLKDMIYTSKDFAKGVSISNLLLNFTPRFVELAAFNAKYSQSDIAASGRIDNLISYLFKDELLTGNFKFSSNYLNLNEFMEGSDEAKQPTDTAESSLSVIEIPGNIDFTLTTTIGKLLYDKMEMNNIKGLVVLKDKKAELKNLAMETLKGRLIVNGSYETVNPEQPKVDFSLNVANFDIQQSYNALVTMQKLAPIAERTTGNFSTLLSLSTSLGKDMMPIYNTMNGKGMLNTSPLTISGTKLFNRLAEETGVEKLKALKLDKAMFAFEFINGRVEVKPFDVKSGNIKANIQGSNGFDQTISYTIKFEVPRSEFGAANDKLNGLVNKAAAKGVDVSLGDMVKIDALITGTVNDPKIQLGLQGMMDNAIQELKDKAKEEAEKLKQEALNKLKEEEAKAKEEAERLKREAEEKLRQEQEKAKAEAERLKKEAEEKAREEAEKKKKEAEEKLKEELKKKIKPPF